MWSVVRRLRVDRTSGAEDYDGSSESNSSSDSSYDSDFEEENKSKP